MDKKKAVQALKDSYTELVAVVARERVLETLGGKAGEDEVTRELERIELSSHADKNLFWLDGRILFIIPNFEVFAAKFVDKITDGLSGLELNVVRLTTEVECFVFAEDEE